MINESQDLPAVGDETSTELVASQTPLMPSIKEIEPQTRKEPAGELMEDEVNQGENQPMLNLVLKEEGQESQRQSELRSELAGEETLQDLTQGAVVSKIREGSLKASDDSQYGL